MHFHQVDVCCIEMIGKVWLVAAKFPLPSQGMYYGSGRSYGWRLSTSVQSVDHLSTLCMFIYLCKYICLS